MLRVFEAAPEAVFPQSGGHPGAEVENRDATQLLIVEFTNSQSLRLLVLTNENLTDYLFNGDFLNIDVGYGKLVQQRLTRSNHSVALDF